MSDKTSVKDESEFNFPDNIAWLMGATAACPYVCWVKVSPTNKFNREIAANWVVAKLDLTTEVYAYPTEARRDAQILRHAGRYISGWPPHIVKPFAKPAATKIDYLEITRQIVAGQ